MPKLTVTFGPANADDVAIPLRLSLIAVVGYTRAVDDGETLIVAATREIPLSNTAKGSLTVEDYDGAGPIRVGVRSASGEILLSMRDLAVPMQDRQYSGVVNFTADELRTIRNSLEQAPPPAAYAVRSGQFVVLNEADMNFARRRLLVGLCPAGELAAIRAALNSAIPVPLAPGNVIILATIGAVQLYWVKLGLDGGFDFQLPAAGDEPGWVWILTGAEPWIGLQEDPIREERPEVVIALTPGQGAGAAAGDNTVLPQDVSEAEVIRNADLFGDDPGTSCQPFQNRYRILSERTVFSILRVEQPEIGGEPSVTAQPPILIDLPRIAVLPSLRALTPRPGLFARVRSALGVVAGQPGTAAPAGLAQYNARLTERVRWVRQRSRGRQTMDSAHPAEWEGEASIYQATSVARGHVLEFRIRW